MIATKCGWDESFMAKKMDWDRIKREQIIKRAENSQGFSGAQSSLSNSTTTRSSTSNSLFYVNQYWRLEYLQRYISKSLCELPELDQSSLEHVIAQANLGESEALLFLCQYFLDAGSPHWARFYFEMVFHDFAELSYTEKSEALKRLELAIERFIRNPSFKSRKYQVLSNVSGKVLTDGFRSLLYFESGDSQKLEYSWGGAGFISLRARAQHREANAGDNLATYYNAKRDYEACIAHGDWYSKYLLGCVLLKISDSEARKGKVKLATERREMGKNYLQQALDDGIEEAATLLALI